MSFEASFKTDTLTVFKENKLPELTIGTLGILLLEALVKKVATKKMKIMSIN